MALSSHSIDKRKNSRSRSECTQRVKIHISSRTNRSLNSKNLRAKVIRSARGIVGFGLSRTDGCFNREGASVKGRRREVIIDKDKNLLSGCERKTHQFFRVEVRLVKDVP